MQNEFTVRQIVDGISAPLAVVPTRFTLTDAFLQELNRSTGCASAGLDYTDAVVLSAAQVRTRTGLNPAKVATRMKRL